MTETLILGLIAFALGFAAGNWHGVRRVLRRMEAMLMLGHKGPPS